MTKACGDTTIADHTHAGRITNLVDRNEPRFHDIDATIGVKIDTDRHFTGQSGCGDLLAFNVNHALGRPSLIDSFASQVVGIQRCANSDVADHGHRQPGNVACRDIRSAEIDGKGQPFVAITRECHGRTCSDRCQDRCLEPSPHWMKHRLIAHGTPLNLKGWDRD